MLKTFSEVINGCDLFIINTGKATTSDYIALSDKVEKEVRSKFGLTLEREVFIIGK